MAATASPLKIATPLLLVLVLLAGWSAYWFWAIQFAEKTFNEQRVRQQAKTALTCAGENWGGYPFRIMFTCTGAHLGLDKGRTIIDAPSLDIIAQAYNPNHVIVRLNGPTNIAQPNQGVSLNVEHLPVVTGIKLSAGRFKQASLKVKSVTVRNGADTILTADEINVHGRPGSNGNNGLDIALDGRSVLINPPPAPPVRLDSVTADINADQLPSGLSTSLKQFARASAAAGTVFTLNHATASLGDVSATAAGTATITTVGQINGTLKTTVHNLDALLGDLAARNIISNKQARAANTLLGLFKTKDGIAADLRLKDGQIYWGPLKLGQHEALF